METNDNELITRYAKELKLGVIKMFWTTRSRKRNKINGDTGVFSGTCYNGKLNTGWKTASTREYEKPGSRK